MSNVTKIKDTTPKSVDRNIHISNARVNNLKGISADIERGSLTVITGVSGSGKSSLAFDTLYAEGQRRYVESLSAYARQFMGKMHKPECDLIRGLPPAIAIEQKVNTRNPRSTVGTTTEIYDYLRLLFGRIGRTYSPVSGKEVRCDTVDEIVKTAQQYHDGTRLAVAAPIRLHDGRKLTEQLALYLSAGYSRLIDADGTLTEIEEMMINPDADTMTQLPMLLIDRLAVERDGDEASRLADSVETALFEGNGEAVLLVYADRGSAPERLDFSTRFEADGMTFTPPSDQMFNFNSPYGACPVCEGFGRAIGIDEALVVPDKSKTVYEGAVACWRGPKMDEWRQRLVTLAPAIGFPIHRPYLKLTDEERHILWHGRGAWTGIDGFFAMVEENLYKIQYRIMKARYSGKRTCTCCHGSRLRTDALYVRVGGKTIADLVSMPVSQLTLFFDNLVLEGNDASIAERLLTEIRSRLRFLIDVGLGYLTLDRTSSTLSGGESQRINLATQLGSSLVGSLYILDEPSIGLHSRDTDRLIGVLRRLQRIGNTVVVVEHDEDIMRAADSIIDVGPAAGSNGGEIVYSGKVIPAPADTASLTLRYLDGSMQIPVPDSRRKWRDYVEISGAVEHNLKDVDVRIPLDVLTVVTGVSGSGKSTLVRDILYRHMAMRNGDNPGGTPGACRKVSVSRHEPLPVIFVDQNSIGKSTRSNPATYLKAFDEIRRLFSEQPAAKQMGFPSGYFSFNVEGGRCERCKGEGTITIEMQFMADITIECEECHGQRYKRNVLDIRYRGKNISEVLDMTVDDAIAFFSAAPTDDNTAHRIARKLRPLADVGLGYIKLGQSSSTLSGGENQRVKLAYYLMGESLTGRSMFIFDEPTTGLHFNDIRKLMESLNRLVEHGHTVVIIEHNLDVVKCADHVIDIGPEGGEQGGSIVAVGTPEEICRQGAGYTARYLAPKLALTAADSAGE